MSSRYDVAIVGGGLIGASAAYHLGGHCNAVLIEQEQQAGYHSSGRSAAVLLPPYGGKLARALTRMSIDFLAHPPEGFAELPLLRPRGAIFLAGPDQLALLDHWTPADASSAGIRTLNAGQARELVPILVPERIAAALWLPTVRDIDATALLQGFLRGFKARGGAVLLNAGVNSIRRMDGVWSLETGVGPIHARIIVNAAGAWADPVAELAGARPQGLVPTRRTVVVLDTPGVDPSRWPLVSDVAETFYFKPEAGRLMVSPADQTPVPAQDVQPEEWDMAVAVERLEAATTLRVRRVAHKWAGLRTSSPDQEPLIGFDPDRPDFVWAAGFGGFGVQAAFGAGRCCEALLFRDTVSTELAQSGVDVGQLSPIRLSGGNMGQAH
jgi:D-arginine dehydrogenase